MTSAGNLFVQKRSEGPSDLFSNLKLFPAHVFGRIEVGIIGFSPPKVSTEAGPPPIRYQYFIFPNLLVTFGLVQLEGSVFCLLAAWCNH